jgi:hypothetical protein
VLLLTVAGNVAVPLTGWFYDVHGTYYPIWFIYAGLTVVATILFLLMPRPSLLSK